jgi:hypothetical protein
MDDQGRARHIQKISKAVDDLTCEIVVTEKGSSLGIKRQEVAVTAKTVSEGWLGRGGGEIRMGGAGMHLFELLEAITHDNERSSVADG